MINADTDPQGMDGMAPDEAGPAGGAAGVMGDGGPAPDAATATVAGFRRPRINLTRLAVGTAVIASEQVRGGARTVGGRAAAVMLGLAAEAKDRTDRARVRLIEVIDDAERRGQATIDARRDGATFLVDASIDDAMAWAQVKVLPRFIDDLVPYLISDVMPKLIDGALPEIRDRVVPVIIGDLTTDERVQELILAQSRGLLGQIADQLRTNSTRADDRLEAAAHRVVGRNDKGPAAKAGQTSKGLNEIRGV